MTEERDPMLPGGRLTRNQHKELDRLAEKIFRDADRKLSRSPVGRRRSRNLKLVLIVCLCYMGFLWATDAGHTYTALGLVLIGVLAVWSLEPHE